VNIKTTWAGSYAHLQVVPIPHVVSLLVIVALMLGAIIPSVIARRRDAASAV
jgi:hypothetical protein